MKNIRTPFAVVWSLLSMVSALVIWLFEALLYIPTGFNAPKDAMFLFVGFGAFSEHTGMALVPAVWSIVFVILWIIALVRLKNSRMFEWLIVGDRLASLAVYIISALVIGQDFGGWPLLTVRVIENVIVWAVIAVLYFKRRTVGRIADGG